jgi:hypothetical protein
VTALVQESTRRETTGKSTSSAKGRETLALLWTAEICIARDLTEKIGRRLGPMKAQ